MCNAGVAPSEYWRMCPDEVSLFIDFNTPIKMYGTMTQGDVDDLLEMRGDGEGFI